MSFFNEFKQFARRGNAIDLTVAVVIGGAFGKIVSSLVDGILMPLIGLLLGGTDLTDKFFEFGDLVIKWGTFLQAIIDFIIIALAIFVVIKFINKLQRKQNEDDEKLTNTELLLVEIRDLLKAKISGK